MKLVLISLVFTSFTANATDKYRCNPEKAYTADGVIDSSTLKKNGTHLLIADKSISRCDKKGCDHYDADFIKVANGMVDIKKWYYLKGQFDVQIFNKKMFIENNGRGTIYFGTCIDVN